jgi:hypothetical protein
MFPDRFIYDISLIVIHIFNSARIALKAFSECAGWNALKPDRRGGALKYIHS